MGGCASKPKEFRRVAEAPIKSKKTRNETGDHKNVDGGENKTENSLVEVPESKEEALSELRAGGGGGGELVSSKEDGAVEPVKEGEVDRKSSKEEAKSNEPTKEK